MGVQISQNPVTYLNRLDDVEELEYLFDIYTDEVKKYLKVQYSLINGNKIPMIMSIAGRTGILAIIVSSYLRFANII